MVLRAIISLKWFFSLISLPNFCFIFCCLVISYILISRSCMCTEFLKLLVAVIQLWESHSSLQTWVWVTLQMVCNIGKDSIKASARFRLALPLILCQIIKLIIFSQNFLMKCRGHNGSLHSYDVDPPLHVSIVFFRYVNQSILQTDSSFWIRYEVFLY